MYLVDSDVIIDLLRGVKGSKEFLLKLFESRAFISVLTVAEIMSGKETKQISKREHILKFLKNFEIISVDYEVAVLAGEIRRDYSIPMADSIIAASALKNSLAIVTYNTKHFEKIPDLEVVKPDYREKASEDAESQRSS